MNIGDTIKIKGQEDCPILTIIGINKVNNPDKKIDKKETMYNAIFYCNKDRNFKGMKVHENAVKKA